MMERPRYRKATDVVQLGRDPRKYLGAVNTPIFRATTILFPTVADLEDAALGRYTGLSYGLHGLPTVVDFQSAMAALEGGFAALAVPSGLTATTLPFLALAKPGDHVLVTDIVYGPTRRFCENHLKRLGVDVSYYDPHAGAKLTFLGFYFTALGVPICGVLILAAERFTAAIRRSPKIMRAIDYLFA